MMEDRLKNATDEPDKENALKEVTEATVREKITTTRNTEERARVAKRAHVAK